MDNNGNNGNINTAFGMVHIEANNVESLHSSVIANDMDNLQKLLFTNRVDVNAIDQNGRTAMYHAIFLKNLDAIKLLVQAGAYVNTIVKVNHLLKTALYTAIEARATELTKFLVSLGAKVNARCNLNNETPLLLAANKKNFQYNMIEVLLKAGANVNVHQYYHGRKPLHVLAEHADIETIKLLLNYNADPNAVDIDGHVPLYYAIIENNTEVTKLLVDVTTTPKNTSLHAAVMCNKGESNFALIEKLLRKGFDPSFQDSHRNTPLHYLVLNTDTVNIIRLFLRFGADVGVKNMQGETPLTYAILGGDVEKIRLLIGQCYDLVNHPTKKFTILHRLAFHNTNDKYFEFAETVLKSGADVNARDNRGNTPLHCLMQKAGVKIVQLFLDHKANVSATNREKETPLFHAFNDSMEYITNLVIVHGYDSKIVKDAEKNRYEVIELLLRNGANVNFQDSQKKTPFHYVCRKSEIEVAKLFLDFKADVNLKDRSGEIPLFYAIRNGRVEIVKLLIDYGSDINSVNNKGFTPLHLACVWRDLRVIKCLLRNGGDINAIDSKRRTPLMAMIFESKPHQAVLEFVLKYADVNQLDSQGRNVLTIRMKDSNMLKVLLEHLAKMKFLDIALDSSLSNEISSQKELKFYFEDCLKELELAKNTKFPYCWVSFFNLLVDNKRMLKNYAGNSDLIENFKKNDCLNKFKIYGASMSQNFTKAVERRKLFDRSVNLLSNCLPILNPSHLVIRDILDCVTSNKELLKFCEND